MMTLKSYSVLSWNKIYLFLKLDDEFLPFADELNAYIHSIFPTTKVYITWDRFETQDDWKPIIKKILKTNDLVWFTQNDDHPFVDINDDLIKEGQLILERQKNSLASVYLSHWPEILKLSGKNMVPLRTGNYISFNATLFDAIQIFTPALLKYVFCEIEWVGNFTRIDTILRQRKIWGESGNTDLELQIVYVPLREQCRKFMGYSHVNMNSVAMLRPTYDLAFIDRSPSSVQNLMTAKHKSLWTKENRFKIPQRWINDSQDLYNG
jgi:hypothetical protein